MARGLAPERLVLVNPIGAPALEGPRGVMTRLAVLYYRTAAALPERAGFALLRNGAIVRVMSVTMAKTRSKSLRRWIHDQHDRYFSAFGDRDAVLEAFRASVSHDVSEVRRRHPGAHAARRRRARRRHAARGAAAAGRRCSPMPRSR